MTRSDHLEKEGWKMSFCSRHTIDKGVRWHRAWGTEHNSMWMKQTLLKTKKYFAMNLMNFQPRLCRYYIFQVWKERILYNLWCKNLLGTHLRRKPQRVRLEFIHLMAKAKEIRTYCLISNMFICGGWTVLFPFFSFMLLNSHVPLQAKWNKSGLPGAVRFEEELGSHKERKRVSLKYSNTKVSSFVLLSKLSVEKEVNYSKS